MIKILIVDDDELTRLLVVSTLESLYRELMEAGQLRISTAEDGLRAVEVAKDEAPDLILMDVRMPELDGVDAFYQLKAQAGGQAPRLYFVTGYDKKGEIGARVDQAVRDGALGSTGKPLVPEVLDRIFRDQFGDQLEAARQDLDAGATESESEWATSDDLRYPIGLFDHQGSIDDDLLEQWIDWIAALPGEMRRAVDWLDDEQLDTAYRPGGWTLRQVVHHVPDSHLNSYIRFKWALTEDEPTIKAYDEQGWAELADYRDLSIESSLGFLESLHEKWVVLLRGLSRQQLARRFVHPDSGPVELAWNVGNYAWHGRHHLAHITTTIDRLGWRPRD